MNDTRGKAVCMAAYSEQLWAKVREGVEAGMSYREAQERYGIHFATIGEKARLQGWRSGVRVERWATEEEAKVGRAEKAVEALGGEGAGKEIVRRHKGTMLELNMESRRLVAEIVKSGLEYLRGLEGEEVARRHAVVRDLVATAETLFGWKALSEVERHAAQVVAMRESGIEGPAVNVELLMTSPERLKAMGGAG
jgi:hypothetical protein